MENNTFLFCKRINVLSFFCKAHRICNTMQEAACSFRVIRVHSGSCRSIQGVIVGRLSPLPTENVSTPEIRNCCNEVLNCDSFNCLLNREEKIHGMSCNAMGHSREHKGTQCQSTCRELGQCSPGHGPPMFSTTFSAPVHNTSAHSCTTTEKDRKHALHPLLCLVYPPVSGASIGTLVSYLHIQTRAAAQPPPPHHHSVAVPPPPSHHHRTA